MEKASLKTYALISGWGFPKTYRGKIVLAALLAAQAPLLATALYLLLGSSAGSGVVLWTSALLMVVALGGAALALLALGALLAPLRLASSALERYRDDRSKPDLPTGFSDEAGRLMADARHAIEYLDSTIRSLEGLSGTDHLTGLPNRRSGEERLAEDLARAKRGGAFLTVAVVDVNKFKTINDTHGHHAGDLCIRHVADVMRRSVREGDWLARWGGDEFVLALWEPSLFASPEAALGRINAELRRSPVRLSGGEELVAEHQRGGAPVRGRGRFPGDPGEGGRGDVPGQARGEGLGALRLESGSLICHDVELIRDRSASGDPAAGEHLRA